MIPALPSASQSYFVFISHTAIKRIAQHSKYPHANFRTKEKISYSHYLFNFHPMSKIILQRVLDISPFPQQPSFLGPSGWENIFWTEQAISPALDQNTPWSLQERHETVVSLPSSGIPAQCPATNSGSLLAGGDLAPSVLRGEKHVTSCQLRPHLQTAVSSCSTSSLL